MHALFSVCSLRDDNVITSKPTWKLKHTNSILEYFEYFCHIQFDPYNFELYRFKVGALFLRHRQCRYSCWTRLRTRLGRNTDTPIVLTPLHPRISLRRRLQFILRVVSVSYTIALWFCEIIWRKTSDVPFKPITRISSLISRQKQSVSDITKLSAVITFHAIRPINVSHPSPWSNS